MKRPILALAIAALLLAALAPDALATTTKTPISGSAVATIIDAGEVTITADTYSIRGMVASQDVAVAGWTGHSIGDETVVINMDIDIATGGGTLWGTPHVEFADGAMDCHLAGTIVPGSYGYAWTAHDVCHGSGGLDGWQMRTDLAYVNLAVTFAGYVFRPGDR